MQVTGGATDVTTYFALRLAADGTAATGLTITDLDLQYTRSGVAPTAKVDATELAATDSAHADNNAKEIDSTDQPGLYRVDWPDAAFAAGVPEVVLTVKVGTAFTEHLAVQIDPPVDVTKVSGDATAADNLELACDNYSVTRGLTGTALPAAVVDAAGGLPISDAGGLNMDAMANHVNSLAYFGPRGPGVYLDDGAANTNTVVGTDGIESNAVSTIAAATTIAGSLGIQRIYLVNDTLITLAQTYEGWEFIGIGLGNQITLGSQDVDNSQFSMMTLTGTQGGTGMINIDDCSMTGLVSLECIANHCYLTGTNTVRASSLILFDGCKSAVPGDATPELTFSGGVSSVNFRHYSGGLQINSMGTGDVMSLETDGQVIVDVSCTDGKLTVRGALDVDDQASGAVDITRTAALNLPDIAAAVWDRVLTGATHNIANSAGRRLRQIQEAGGYSGGAIYIDTVNGVAGTTNFENGVDSNPVDSIADANTLAASLGISLFRVSPGSSITLAAAQNNQVFKGTNWTLALGGQDIAGTTFVGADVSGVAAGTGTLQQFIMCTMGATTHRNNTHCVNCGMEGTQTQGEAGSMHFDNCHSEITGGGVWTYSFGAAIGNTALAIMGLSGGGVQLEAMGDTGTDTAAIYGRGTIIEGTCTGGTVTVGGHFTTSGFTNLTLSDDARIDVAQINAEVDAALVDIHLDHLFATDYDPASKPGVATGLLNELIGDDSGVSQFTANALELAPGGGASITDILNVVPMLPWSIDLANTATVRLGLMLTNALDDLPSTAEITPGTISIDRKAIGGTSWTSIVADAACSESAGQIYYDEVFDSGTGYAEGDSIRITFKSQKITVAANDYEITDATGRMFYIEIRQTSTGSSAATIADAVWDEANADHRAAGSMGLAQQETKAMVKNKRTHTISTGVDVVYDDDDATPLVTVTPNTSVSDEVTLDHA